MSQDDQRNQPSPPEQESPASSTTPAAGSSATSTPSTPSATSPTSPISPTAQAASGTTAATPPHHTARRREFHEPGDGAPRYATAPEQIPRSGSEESWSAQPNPGYQPDPAINYSTKRLVTGALIGAILMTGFVVYAVRILANRSSNGNGSAPWTAAVERDGAVLGGINAQNNGAAHPIPLPADLTFGDSGSTNADAINNAVASCRTANATKVPTSAAPGSAVAINQWSAHASPTVQKLRNDAANLQQALTLGHVAAVANSADNLCSSYPGIAAIPAMPDAVGSQAWSAAVSSFAAAATESLRGAGGNPDAMATALENLNKGNKDLDALVARIKAAT